MPRALFHSKSNYLIATRECFLVYDVSQQLKPIKQQILRGRYCLCSIVYQEVAEGFVFTLEWHETTLRAIEPAYANRQYVDCPQIDPFSDDLSRAYRIAPGY
jgi:hypothetical protein